MTASDAAAVYAAGWDEKTLFHAISVTSLFNLMNRIVEGTGVIANPTPTDASKQSMSENLDNSTPYADFARLVNAQ